MSGSRHKTPPLPYTAWLLKGEQAYVAGKSRAMPDELTVTEQVAKAWYAGYDKAAQAYMRVVAARKKSA